MRRERRGALEGGPALQTLLEQLLDGEAARRLFEVEKTVRATYEAFPKNSRGQLPPSEIFPAIVRGYFRKEHGWLLKGLEPPGLVPEATRVHQALLLREDAPALATALQELHDADQGLALSDVVGTIAVLEHLALRHSETLLRGAYVLNERSVEEPMAEGVLMEVLHSYLLLFRHGHPQNLTDVAGHRRMKERAQRSPDWVELVRFAASVVPSSSEGSFSFAVVSQLVRELAQRFGKWQNAECSQMKDVLMGMGAEGSGSVLLKDFHAEPKHASFQFTESAEYLRRAGTLLEPVDGEPRVFIANYVLGPSNCIAPSKHYSVCCLSECEALMSELERQVQAPSWPAAQLLELVASTSSSSVSAPRQMPPAMAQALEAIADRNDGAVPLHSADFMRWLHEAFPNECPAPTASESAAEESERKDAAEWLDVQQECTRIPQWHPKAGDDVISV